MIHVNSNGIINDVFLDISEINRNVATFDYSITFDGIMDSTDVQIYTCDTKRNALTFTIENALVVTQGTDILSNNGSSGMVLDYAVNPGTSSLNVNM